MTATSGRPDRGEQAPDASRAREAAPAPGRRGVRISTETIQAVLDHLRAEGRNEVHVQNVKRYLADWGRGEGVPAYPYK